MFERRMSNNRTFNNHLLWFSSATNSFTIHERNFRLTALWLHIVSWLIALIVDDDYHHVKRLQMYAHTAHHT